MPKSLFGQTILILLVGLVISHAVGAWIYAGAREQAVRAIGGFAAAQRVANLSRLVEDAPAEWRPRLVAALSDPTFRVALTAQPPQLPPSEAEGAAKAVEDYVRQQLRERPDRQVRAAVLAPTDGPPGAPFGPPFDHRPFPGPMGGGGMMHQMMGPGFGPFGGWRGLQVAVQLGDGQWLSFVTALPQDAPSVSWQFIVSMALMGVIVLAVSVWAVRRVTAPLGLLSAAADRLGRDVTAAPLAESRQRRDAARRARLQPHAAAAAPADREPYADAGRAVARSAHAVDAFAAAHGRGRRCRRARQDAGDHRRDGRDDRLDARLRPRRGAGRAAPQSRHRRAARKRRRRHGRRRPAGDHDGGGAAIHDCQPGALKRALTNLLDNAVKYGKCARAAIASTGGIEITIDDDGPGIPEAELAKVFQPFYRVEDSRSRDTGGTGLGLAIAQAIVQAQGGELTLANRPGGGLRATIKLPA